MPLDRRGSRAWPGTGQFQTVRRFEGFTSLTGHLDDLLCKGIPVPQINCEIGVPLDRFAEAQEQLERWHRTNRPAMHYPFILRAIGPSNAWLSPAYRRETCYYGTLVYQASDGTFSRDSYRALRDASRILADHAGVPHWGKYFDPHDFDFRHLLPRWRDFHDLRRAVDPHQRFTSRYLADIFNTTPAPRRRRPNDQERTR